MSNEELEKSLHSEIESYLGGRLGDVKAEISRLHNQLNEAFTGLLERAFQDGEAPSDSAVAATIAEHLRSAHERGVEFAAAESAKAQSASDAALLKAAIEEIDNQRSQADILNALVNRAASFAPRVAFFVVRNEMAQGWRARGLEGTVGDDAIRQVALSLNDEHAVSEACRSHNPWSGAPGANAQDHILCSHFGSEPPQHLAALPLTIRNKVVAVLYADSGALDSQAVKLEALEALVRVTGMAVELLAVTRGAPSVSTVTTVAGTAVAVAAVATQTEAAEETAPAEAEAVAETPVEAAEVEAVAAEESAAETVAEASAEIVEAEAVAEAVEVAEAETVEEAASDAPEAIAAEAETVEFAAPQAVEEVTAIAEETAPEAVEMVEEAAPETSFAVAEAAPVAEEAAHSYYAAEETPAAEVAAPEAEATEEVDFGIVETAPVSEAPSYVAQETAAPEIEAEVETVSASLAPEVETVEAKVENISAEISAPADEAPSYMPLMPEPVAETGFAVPAPPAPDFVDEAESVPEPQSYAAPVTDAPAPNTASWDMVESATRDTAPNFNLNETVMADAPANLYETVATEAPANPYETVAMDAPAAVPQPTFAPPPVPESFTPPTPEGFTAPPVAEPFIPPAPPTPEPFAEAKAGDAPAPGSFAPVPPPQNYTAPLGSARTFGREIDLPINVNEDERRLHTDARRFARLLVSEIKLYNEPKVQEGRESGNIYNLLREAIDRSRQMYDRRVAPPVASQFDYFHYELVNTLAEGDAGKLGQEYPGAAV